MFVNCESHIAGKLAHGLMEVLLHGTFTLCSICKNVHWEIGALKPVFKQDDYFQNFVNHRIKTFLKKLLKGTLIYGS